MVVVLGGWVCVFVCVCVHVFVGVGVCVFMGVCMVSTTVYNRCTYVCLIT